MKTKPTYLKGKSVFTVSLLVIGITVLIVYLTGIQDHRSFTSNLYLSLSIVAFALFLFMSYGLYKGVGLKDDFPKFKNLKRGDYIAQSGNTSDFSAIETGDGISGIVVSILLWIGMTLLLILLIILLEALLWFSIFIILAMLYWIFFRALKFVFSKSSVTKGRLTISIAYSFGYTALYTAWIFGVVFITKMS